jgi:outer membrane immunogenic protein
MKKLFCAGIASLALAGAASAADIPRKMPVKAVPPAPVWNWTGIYLGGYYGTSIAHSSANSSNRLGEVNINDRGLTAGATLGFNWQFNPNWLIGVEGDFGWLGTKESYLDFNDAPNLRVGAKTDWYGTVRGRFGYVTGPSLIYATGGGAFVRVKETFGQPIGTTEDTSTHWGWTAGGGIETKLSRSWTAKTEYLYIDLGSNSFASNAAGNALTANFTNRAHVLKTGFNYQFGNGPFEMFPFLAKPLSSPERWAGFYAGVNAGGGISLVKAQNIVIGATPREEENINGTGFAGGGHIGYNWLLVSNWLVGLEGDIGYLGIDHDFDNWPNAQTSFGVKTDWYSTVRARIGTSTGPAFLYVTGGAAFAHVTNRFGVVGAAPPVPEISKTRSGWTFGGGIETELTSRWSARLEYLYMNLGTSTLDDSVSLGAPLHIDYENRFQVVRAGLSYKFGGPDVVTARY